MPLGEMLLLFGAVFFSSTLIPGASETVLFYFWYLGYSKILLIVLATLGNVGGAVVNYWLGFWGSKWLSHPWVGFRKESLVKANKIFAKWGSWAIFFSFLPIIGDPITAIAGLLKYPFFKFLFIMTSGKFLRYLLMLHSLDLYRLFYS